MSLNMVLVIEGLDLHYVVKEGSQKMSLLDSNGTAVNSTMTKGGRSFTFLCSELRVLNMGPFLRLVRCIACTTEGCMVFVKGLGATVL